MNSILDVLNRSDHTKSLAFLDPHGGVTLQRYERMKYPQFDKLTDRQLSFFWLPHEIDIVRDSKDFKEMTPHEQHIFSSNLKRQILLDSVQGRSPNLALLPIVSLPEIEAWITAWSFVEMIHSRSYTHIIRNVYNNPSIVFDQMLDISEIVDCAVDISKYYDDLIHLTSRRGNDLYALKKALWMTIMSINILEGVRFYVSFACSWAFAETKRMEGNAKIIKLICMSDDHEILTNEGWRRFASLTKQERVAQYTTEGNVEFVTPLAYIEEDFDGDMIKLKSANVDALYTPDHRVIYKEKGVIKESTAAEFKPSLRKKFIVSGGKLSGRDELTDVERLRIAVQADGFISDRYTGELCGHIPVFFHLKKERKVTRLLSMLERLRVESITWQCRRNDNGFVDITVNIPLSIAVKKDFAWVRLEEVSSIWADAFFDELSNWDGHIPKDSKERKASEGRIYYSSIASECVDVVQSLAAISNRKQHRSLQEDHRKETYSDVHRLHTQIGNERCCGTNETKSFEHYLGKVYCVTVPSGMIVVRRNGNVYVTANCRDENLHLAATQMLLKLLPQDDPDYVTIAAETVDESTQCFLAAAEQEKAWAKYLFKDGSMIGLNYDLLSQYVEWITHKRMTSVGLVSPFKIRTNPLPWTQKWISGSEVQTAPQESEIVTYTVGDIKQDLTENIFKDITL